MSEIIHRAPTSGTTNLQTLAADRAARALKINDGLAEVNAAAKHIHTAGAVGVIAHTCAMPSEVLASENSPASAVTEASVEAAIVKHREEEAPRPNMVPVIKQRVASVGAGSTRSVPHMPFVPNQPKPIKQSSVGSGQAKRPVPESIIAPAPAAPAAPAAITAESIAQAIAASRPAAPAPQVMAAGKPRR